MSELDALGGEVVGADGGDVLHRQAVALVEARIAERAEADAGALVSALFGFLDDPAVDAVRRSQRAEAVVKLMHGIAHGGGRGREVSGFAAWAWMADNPGAITDSE